MRFLERLFFKIGKSGMEQYLKSVELRNGDVLDVGCGNGLYSELFSQNYTGVDTNPKAIAAAKKEYTHAHFEVMDATKLSFPDESFFLVFSVGVFHHLGDNEVGRAFNEMFRVTKMGGHILIIDLVLPERLKYLAYPIFYLDKGSYKRTFNQLAGLLGGDTGPRIQNSTRFLNLESAMFEYQK